MSLERELFPEPDPGRRSENWIQTEWAEGWTAQFAGIGYLTNLVQKHFHTIGALRDQAGLALVFLQRHRLEVGMKTLFNALGEPRTTSHNLTALWTQVKALAGDSTGFEVAGFSGAEAVDQYLKPHDELIRLMSEADPGSFHFRYPVDTANQKVERPRYIDPEALERACKKFEDSIDALVVTLEGGE